MNITRMLGVTIAFTLGATAIAAVAYVFSMAGAELPFAAHVDSWPHAVGLFVGNSALAGLIVDGLRVGVDFIWPAELDSGSRLRRS